MAEEKKFETAEELGEAVGEKIDRLFGGSMDEEPGGGPARPDAQAVTQPGDSTTATTSALDEEREPTQLHSPHSTDEPDTAVSRSPHRAEKKKQALSREELLDRLEALVLKLEWEASVEEIREIAHRFKDMERYLPQEGPARTLITINRRALRRFSRPEVSPHPRLVKLLQESTSAMRQLCATGGRERLTEGLVSSIVKTYNEIMESQKPSDLPAEEGPEIQDIGAVISHMSGAVNSLAEVGHRLARIRADVSQSGEISEEEMTGKLERLERLFADRIGQVSSLHRKLSRLAPLEIAGRSAPQKASDQGESGPDGFLMIEWNGLPVVVPSSLVMALHPLTSSQARQLEGKKSVVLSKRSVPRAPLRLPKEEGQGEKSLPSWLIHFSMGEKEFFILADRALGYRRVPEGTDLSRQRRIKIGKTVYSILNRAAFPASAITPGSE